MTDYSRKWLVMIAIAMGLFLSTIDGTIVNIALPTLQHEFTTKFSVVQWIPLAYLLATTTLKPGFGRLGDMIGKKSVFIVGFIIFTIGSVLCGISPTIEFLIIARIVQAIGGAMFTALTLGLVSEAFPPREQGRAFGIIGTIVSIGIIAGPIIGGMIISVVSWRWIFFVNLPIGIVGIWIAIQFLPRSEKIPDQRFDFLGAVTFFVSLMTLLLALTFGQRIGFANEKVLMLFGSAIIFFMIFISIEKLVDQPMIDLSIFADLFFSLNLFTGFLTFIAISGTVILMPFYLKNVLGFNELKMGLLMSVAPLLMGFASPISGVISDRIGVRSMMIFGMVLLAIGYAALGTLTAKTSGLGFVLRFLPIGLGMGIFQSPLNSAIMSSAPRDRIGVVSGLRSITTTLGQTIGISVIGAIWASRSIAHEKLTLGVTEIGANEISKISQVLGLQNVFAMIAIMMTIGVVICFLNRRERSSLKFN